MPAVRIVGWLMNNGLEMCERKRSWPMPIYRSGDWKQRQTELSIYWQRCEPGKSGIRSGIVTNCTALSDVSTGKSIINGQLDKELRKVTKRTTRQGTEKSNNQVDN